MSISDIRHQDRAIDFFQQALAAGRLSHAFILTGPTGVGKTTTAVALTKMLLCDKPVTVHRTVGGEDHEWRDSCDTCAACRLVAAGTHPDLHRVYKELIATVPGKEAHKATELGIDVIRQEVIEKVGLKPAVGAAKVFIIEETHLMNRSAQNAILKTLEEPPGNTYLFLISEQIGSLLPTIRSRAQTLVFSLLPESFIAERLKTAGAKPAESRFLSQFVPGRLGTALELFRLGVYDLKERLGKDLAALEPVGADDFAQWVLDESKALAEKMTQDNDAPERKARVSESETTRSAIKLIFALAGAYWGDALRMKVGVDETQLVNADRLATVKSLAGKNATERIQEKIETLAEAEKWIDANVNVTLVVTDVIAKMAVN